ncbi:MAG: magnesium transporter [Sulfurovum sp. PC08-66]|nr:MAG: magnesium transporter [Sulfurovum sp. PC08-66]KIM12598.1 MAG: magnesium transporter [Sulfuricurvum sp. PC08-66]
MMKCYYRTPQGLHILDTIEALQALPSYDHVVWIDLLKPTPQETQTIENLFALVVPTPQESQEIEISSRYWEEADQIKINSYFLIGVDGAPHNETVSFILKGDLLMSARYEELRSFDEFNKRLWSAPRLYENGFAIFCHILNIRIDIDADTIENLTKEISKMRKNLFAEAEKEHNTLLKKIAHFEDFSAKIRENLTDKQRILSSLLKSTLYETHNSDIPIMLNDLSSLIEHTNFNFERLDYLQNIFIGMVSITQNKTIKIFTIVNVIFLPPTLIASIYGMNFVLMPELGWKYGYLLSVGMMLFSSVLPLYIFRKKGWM